MEEKILIKSERRKLNKLSLIFACIGIVVFIAYFCYSVNSYRTDYSYIYGYIERPLSEAISSSLKADGGLPFVFLGCLIFPFIGFIIYKAWSQVELVVTDKRVYGKSSFGKRVDLPLDSISAVSTAKGAVAVSTSSGTINFKGIINYDEIHKVLSKLIIERQQNKNIVMSAAPASVSSADELKKYKELLENGIITEEEFNAKKKQLLGL